MTVEEFFDHVITVRMREDRSSLDIIDQTLLPGTIKRINLNTKEEIWEAIKKLRVRGAPAIALRLPMELPCWHRALPRTSMTRSTAGLRN